VQRSGFSGSVDGGINMLLGNMFNINGPTLWAWFVIHDPGKTADEILKAADLEIAALQERPVDQATLDRAMVKLRSALYGEMEQFVGFGKVDLLASFALFDDDPGRINRLEDEFKAVTPELIQKTAREYLRPTNRTVLVLEPKAAPAAAAAQKK